MDQKFIKVNEIYRWGQGVTNINDMYINPKYITNVKCDEKECKLFMKRDKYIENHIYVIPRDQFIKPPFNSYDYDKI